MRYTDVVIFVNLLACAIALPRYSSDTETFELSVIHINDFHARFEQTNTAGGKCKKETACIAGLGRIKTEINEILAEKPNSLVLNGGDNFQGTLYYNIFKYNITAHFLNTIPFDAVVLGNHEFDDGIAGVVPFMQMMKAPIVLSNVDDMFEPTFQGLYKKSVVVERNGKKIGIIGVIIQSCNEISNTEKLIFLDESTSVNEEAERLVRDEGVFTNIVLSHSGYGIEKLIAQSAKNKISMIVGGHSHSFLYTGDNPPGPDKPAGPYPTVITSDEGKTILVTQASAYTKYLGNITVFYDEEGNIKDWSGAPIYMENEIEQDQEYLNELMPYSDVVRKSGNDIIGSTLVRLERDDCRMGECLLGNFVTDAMVFSYIITAPKASWTKAAIALMNTGGLRTSIAKGNITYDDMITAQPFANDLYMGEVTGQDLKDIFEFSASPYFYGRTFININILQVSGVHMVMDIRKPIGQRITTLQARCSDCQIPIYENVSMKKIYRVIVPSFLMRGGDGFSIIPERMKNVQIGEVDMDAFSHFLHNRSPLFEEVEGRIQILGVEKIVARDLFS
ncbi:apyrase-like [Harmonia axyridis]|uniref:apyrase-like n=1 Tax=Harmonia axyridis TaxID=115357 RepID=UPI001E27766C|nr:apyrase-like [Harmonia axyridis]